MVRTIREGEGELLKFRFVTMSIETPTAFAGTVAELERRTDEEWLHLAAVIASSPSMESFVVENEGAMVGLVTRAILAPTYNI